MTAITAIEQATELRMTRQRRQVRDFVLGRRALDRPPTLGEVVRCCGLHCRGDAKRIIRDLVAAGLLPPSPITPGKPGRPKYPRFSAADMR